MWFYSFENQLNNYTLTYILPLGLGLCHICHHFDKSDVAEDKCYYMAIHQCLDNQDNKHTQLLHSTGLPNTLKTHCMPGTCKGQPGLLKMVFWGEMNALGIAEEYTTFPIGVELFNIKINISFIYLYSSILFWNK